MMYDLLMADKEYLNNNNFKKILILIYQTNFSAWLYFQWSVEGVMPLDGISVEINFIKR